MTFFYIELTIQPFNFKLTTTDILLSINEY